ncbi:hypothetical protein MBAV_004776 [Candidatus Magnetobacterium bavaricum]|uniref:Uncharacterized protein n=1 Tax=Candidatus Magnetobacterium bavaricum TaxID=29290 RepID=A0A0F3GM30_9BACT|nr:hypothetical protein MBAV_004776 [Candidatus Magnetobacterium bavaricum]
MMFLCQSNYSPTCQPAHYAVKGSARGEPPPAKFPHHKRGETPPPYMCLLHHRNIYRNNFFRNIFATYCLYING